MYNKKVSNAIAFVNSLSQNIIDRNILSLISKEDGKKFHLCDRPEC